MNFKIIFFISILFLAACQNTTNKKDLPNTEQVTTDIPKKTPDVKEVEEKEESSQGFITDQKYRNIGFTLIYDEKLIEDKQINKKIDNTVLGIFHKKIFKNSFVKIINPENNKSIIAKVISNDVVFSDFYNSVITTRIVDELSINPNNPYIELILFSKKSTFVAKKAKTFEEEKHVADKAPVEVIEINNLGSTDIKKNKISLQKFTFSIKIADFYFKDSAENMIKRIKDETNIKTSIIKKLSNTKYRVLIGPFNDIKNLEKSFNELKPLEFENIEILKNV
tara:strand:- start:3284 stop:4123 length:840 start_codon:yes stop_codon:yes gene_type:complete